MTESQQSKLSESYRPDRHPTENQNERAGSRLVSALMFPDHDVDLNFSTREEYDHAQQALQVEIGTVYDDLQLDEKIEENLKKIKNPTREQTFKVIADTLFTYSYSRKHGGFENLFLKYIKTGKFGFNCEMSSGMVNEALRRRGFEPQILKNFWTTETSGEHYMSCVVDPDGDINVLDIYTYEDHQNSSNVYTITPDILEKMDRVSFIRAQNHRNAEKFFYLYPKGIGFDILQTLKALRDIKDIAAGAVVVEDQEFLDKAHAFASQYPDLQNFDFDALKSKLALFDVNDSAEKLVEKENKKLEIGPQVTAGFKQFGVRYGYTNVATLRASIKNREYTSFLIKIFQMSPSEVAQQHRTLTIKKIPEVTEFIAAHELFWQETEKARNLDPEIFKEEVVLFLEKIGD